MTIRLSKAGDLKQKIVNWYHNLISQRVKNSRRGTIYLGLIGLVICLAIALITPTTHAQSTVVQSYSSTGDVQTGMLVALTNSQSDIVTPVTSANLNKIYGVAINPANTDAILSTGSGNLSKPVYVATSGSYEILISSQDGPIKTGDYISVSSLDGIGMKATDSQSLVLGKALAPFDGKTNVINTATLTSNTGKKLTVSLAQIPVSINVVRNPELNRIPDLPGFLTHLTQSVANKPVDAARAYISLGILVITVVIVGIMIYSGVRSSIISIGRNPLSRHSIMVGLLGISLTSIAVFIVGLFAVYLLLKL